MSHSVKNYVLIFFLVVIPVGTILALPDIIFAVPLFAISIYWGLCMAAFISFLGILSPKHFSYSRSGERSAAALILLGLLIVLALLYLPVAFLAIASVESFGASAGAAYDYFFIGALIYGPALSTLPLFLRKNISVEDD